MTWPTPPNNTPVPTTNMDSGLDKPADARADIKLLTDRVNSLEEKLKLVIENGSPVITSRTDGKAGDDSIFDGAVSKRAYKSFSSTITWPNAANIFKPDDQSNISGTGAYVDITTTGGIVRVDGVVNFSCLCTNAAVASIEVLANIYVLLVGNSTSPQNMWGAQDHRAPCNAFGGRAYAGSLSMSFANPNFTAGQTWRIWVGLVQIRAFDANGTSLVTPGASVDLKRSLFISAIELNK